VTHDTSEEPSADDVTTLDRLLTLRAQALHDAHAAYKERLAHLQEYVAREKTYDDNTALPRYVQREAQKLVEQADVIDALRAECVTLTRVTSYLNRKGVGDAKHADATP
jgi:hypothetical protein